jgi:hypothetical protein
VNVNYDMEDIPSIESLGRRGRRASPDSPFADGYPTTESAAPDVSGLFGISLGLQLAGRLQRRLFPTANLLAALQGVRAPGRAPSYSTYFDCGGVDYNGTCNEACYGFAPHHMDPFYCATCDEQAADPANNPAYNWHFVGSRGTLQYIDREPDVCPGPSGSKDAWKWKVGACGNCQQSAVFRCHDGYKKYPDSASWSPTICQGLVSCDDRLTTC